MKAIILNSGIGKRMGDLTANKPKCLVTLKDNETILASQLKTLKNTGIKKILMTTGPFEELIREEIRRKFPDLDITFVYNSKYEKTNYIYSLALCKEQIDDDILLMHGDLVFDQNVLENLLNDEHENAVMINYNAALTEKDFKGRISNYLVKEIGIEVFGDDSYMLMPLYKFSKEAFDKWMSKIEEFILEGKTSVYAENALNMILDNISLFGKSYDKELCCEIDNPEDLVRVRNILKNKSDNN